MAPPDRGGGERAAAAGSAPVTGGSRGTLWGSAASRGHSASSCHLLCLHQLGEPSPQADRGKQRYDCTLNKIALSSLFTCPYIQDVASTAQGCFLCNFSHSGCAQKAVESRSELQPSFTASVFTRRRPVAQPTCRVPPDRRLQSSAAVLIAGTVGWPSHADDLDRDGAKEGGGPSLAFRSLS